MRTIAEIVRELDEISKSVAVQFRHKNSTEDWVDCAPSWNFSSHEYREKPQPRKRLIRVEELKLPCLVRFGEEVYIVVGYNIKTQELFINYRNTYSYLIARLHEDNRTYSIDNGITWNSFEVEE